MRDKQLSHNSLGFLFLAASLLLGCPTGTFREDPSESGQDGTDLVSEPDMALDPDIAEISTDTVTEVIGDVPVDLPEDTPDDTDTTLTPATCPCDEWELDDADCTDAVLSCVELTEVGGTLRSTDERAEVFFPEGSVDEVTVIGVGVLGAATLPEPPPGAAWADWSYGLFPVGLQLSQTAELSVSWTSEQWGAADELGFRTVFGFWDEGPVAGSEFEVLAGGGARSSRAVDVFGVSAAVSLFEVWAQDNAGNFDPQPAGSQWILHLGVIQGPFVVESVSFDVFTEEGDTLSSPDEEETLELFSLDSGETWWGETAFWCDFVGDEVFGGSYLPTLEWDSSTFGIDVFIEKHVDCEAIDGAAAGGMVFLDIDLDREFDEGEPGMPDLEVHIARVVSGRNLPLLTRLRTDHQGEFVFDQLIPGEYEISLPETTLPRSLIGGVVEPESVLTGAGLVVQLDPIPVWADGALEGKVVEDINLDGVADTGEPEVVGVEVVVSRLDERSGGTVEMSRMNTDDSGSYRFETLPPATYFIDLAPLTLPEDRYPIVGSVPLRVELELGEHGEATTILISEDPDGDGLTNAEERALGTNILSADSDSDGLDDGSEVNAFGTDPLAPDTDGDGLWDVEETYFFHSDPVDDADSDDDELSDWSEAIVHGTDPSLPDSDSDGLDDLLEVQLGLNARRSDTDGDGLADDVELDIGTSPLYRDTDSDGIDDIVEVGSPGDPSNTDGEGRIDALDFDSDEDGLSDLQERFAHASTDPLSVHDDDDGVPNFRDADSDGDGRPDGDDNCPSVENADQTDGDGDGWGDLCDDEPEAVCDQGIEDDSVTVLAPDRVSAPGGFMAFGRGLTGPAGDRFSTEVCPGGRFSARAYFDELVLVSWEWSDTTEMTTPLRQLPLGTEAQVASAEWVNEGDEPTAVELRLTGFSQPMCIPYHLRIAAECDCEVDDLGKTSHTNPFPTPSRGVVEDLWIRESEVDWFEIPVCAGGSLEVRARTQSGTGVLTATAYEWNGQTTIPSVAITDENEVVGFQYTAADGSDSLLVGISAGAEACLQYQLETRLSGCDLTDEGPPPELQFDRFVSTEVAGPGAPDIYQIELCPEGRLIVDAYLISAADPNESVISLRDGDVEIEDSIHPRGFGPMARQVSYESSAAVPTTVEVAVSAWSSVPLAYSIRARLDCPCDPDDEFEDNDSADAAKLVNPYDGLFNAQISPLDEDWYAVPLCELGFLSVDTVQVDASKMGISLYFGDSRMPVASGETIRGLTHTVFTNPLNELVTVLVRTQVQAGSNVCVDHTQTFSMECLCAPDRLEEDDVAADATDIDPGGETITRLRAVQYDKDFFRIPLCAQGELDVTARFFHSEGNIDLFLREESGAQIAAATSGTDNELLSYDLDFGVPKSVWLEVRMNEATKCPYYDLEVAINCPLDTDGDGLTDIDDAFYGSDPNLRDTDGDGIEDGDEVYLWETDPNDRDSDDDGIEDWVEAFETITNPAEADTDAGGLDDGDEIYIYHTNPNDRSDDIVITTANPLPDATSGVGYTFRFQAVGGRDPYEWSGDPPFGTIQADGLWSGAPNTAGARKVHVTVESGRISHTRSFDVTVR